MLKVLLVEDEKLERDAIKMIIERENLDAAVIAEAGNGLEALDLYELHHPDVCFVDIRIPGINGLEFVREVKSRGGDAEFIIVSAYDYFDYAKNAIALGVKEYLLKPVRKEEIRRILEELIGEKGRSESADHSRTVSVSIDAAMKYIDDNYMKDISLSDVAEVIHLNPFYFSRHFKEEVGINFSDYLTKVRIREAKRLLLETDMNVTEIALAVGYRDSNYFSRVFRRAEEVPPRVFRQLNRDIHLTRKRRDRRICSRQ